MATGSCVGAARRPCSGRAALTRWVGLTLGLVTQSVAGALVGFAFLGLGLSGTTPVTISVAGHAGNAAQAVAAVSAMAHVGSFVARAVTGTWRP